ncbi:hypothetical protein P3X46_031647 [Hevea brasiliensis]|uniref:Phytosulfokine-beta n=1 Tax=Hevea brasiliensis TaxID=3981 RepID=A0ABQ9KLX1_HEVBR|nr:uncharacterized protein LOC110641888 [Hevea brasiliensis]KAJ9141067.1 hypothetical protein P3X46_031647 [Hevea brasiliensis]
MRPALIVSLLLLSFLLHDAQGIRLEKEFMQVGHQKIHEDKSSLIKRSNGAFGEVILCKEGHCTGMNRKLTTVTTSTPSPATSTSKNEENVEENKANPMTSKGRSSNEEVGGEQEKFTINSSPASEHQEVNHDDHYVDIMDYSPAKRKPPIHN